MTNLVNAAVVVAAVRGSETAGGFGTQTLITRGTGASQSAKHDSSRQSWDYSDDLPNQEAMRLLMMRASTQTVKKSD